MTTKRQSWILNLELDTDVERRLQSAAARRGTTVPRYCQSIIEGALEREEAPMQSQKSSWDDLFALRDEIFGDTVLTGDSAEIIREERELRASVLLRNDVRLSAEELRARRLERSGGRPSPVNSVDLIREAREERDAQSDEW